MQYDYLIVGAGFAGSVLAERIATQLNKKVLVVEKRDHIGGNAYDYYNDHGILVHKYGPHLFHTNDPNVVRYLSAFTYWKWYEHRVLARVDGMLLPFPINLDTLNLLYKLNLETSEEAQAFLDSKKVPIQNPQNAEELVLSQVGFDLYKKFFYGYTKKQWGLEPTKLAASVTARIPVRTNHDSRYFTDTYQIIPSGGYSKMFENILASKNIEISLGTEYKTIVKDVKFDRMIFTGPIDEFFDYLHGQLPYRAVRFDHETLDREFYQEVATVNFPNDEPFTRITEWKYITGQNCPRTSIVREYPEAGTSEKYYPIPSPETNILFAKYKAEAEKLATVTFCGRLADYRYYNMDQVVARALHIFEEITRSR